jgi:hypothetical protein
MDMPEGRLVRPGSSDGGEGRGANPVSNPVSLPGIGTALRNPPVYDSSDAAY